jgi:hypothetical protein
MTKGKACGNLDCNLQGTREDVEVTFQIKPNVESAAARDSPAVDKSVEIDEFATN